MSRKKDPRYSRNYYLRNREKVLAASRRDSNDDRRAEVAAMSPDRLNRELAEIYEYNIRLGMDGDRAAFQAREQIKDLGGDV